MSKWIVADNFDRSGPLDGSRASYSSGLSTILTSLANLIGDNDFDDYLYADQWVAPSDGIYTSGGRIRSAPNAAGTIGFMPWVSLSMYKKSTLIDLMNTAGEPPSEDEITQLLYSSGNSILQNDNTACMFTDFQHDPFTENRQAAGVFVGFGFSSAPLLFYADGDIRVPDNIGEVLVDDTGIKLSTKGLVVSFSQDFFRVYRNTDFISNRSCVRFHYTLFYYISDSADLPASLDGYGLYGPVPAPYMFPGHYAWVGVRQFVAGFDDPDYSVVGQSNFKGRLEFIGPHTGANNITETNIPIGPFFIEEELPMGSSKVYVESAGSQFMRPGFALKTMAYNESVMDFSTINVPSTPSSNIKFRKTLIGPTPMVGFNNPYSPFVIGPPVEVSFDDMLAYGISGGSGGWNVGSVSGGSGGGGASFLAIMVISLVLINIFGFK